MRADLVALTEEDLAAYSNRGTVNRAVREAAGQASGASLVESPDGALQATWSDGCVVEIPAGQPLTAARCSCLATGVCRHLVRSVIHYQRTRGAAAPTGPWDPGAIPDEELARCFSPAALDEARRLLAAGILAELVRSAKPLARFHGLGCNVRFRVPGNLHYAAADSAPALAPARIVLAVWVFRRLAPEVRAGFVVTGTAAPAPIELLDAVETSAQTWFRHGLEGAPPHFGDDVRRLEAGCAEAGLVWPAANLASFAEEVSRYAARDALFTPERAVAALGELLARADAIRAGTGAVPQPLVRGSRSDRVTELATARFLGLGTSVIPRQKGVTLLAYFQNLGTGDISTAVREFTDETASAPRPFHRLAEVPVAGGAGLGQLARAQLLVAKAKCSATGALTFGRSRLSAAPHGWAWEQIREPILVDDFDELRARLAALPPAALRPLRAAEGFHALVLEGTEGARFDTPRQAIVAVLRDTAGRTATLEHPYTSRGHRGAEQLLERLRAAPARFVAGRVSLTAAGLIVAPAAVVFEEAGARTAVLPWTDGPGRAGEASGAHSEAAVSEPAHTRSNPLAAHLVELQDALVALLQTGLRRADEVLVRRLRALGQRGESLGLGHLPAKVVRLAQALEARLRDPRSDGAEAAALTCELAVLLRLAPEVL